MSKKIITNLFNYAAQEGAHNLVITSQPNHVSFNYHLADGVRRDFSLPKKLEQDFVANLRRILAIAPHELAAKKYCKISGGKSRLTFYLTILPDGEGEKIIISIINRKNNLWRLNQLGLQPRELREIKATIRARSGLIIVSSPEGEGKSATLYSLLKEINDPSLNIYLLDKHPETDILGINPLAPTTANWEKIIRHDCDVIALDGLDEELALKNALLAASSGRLVIGTLTAANSLAVLDKILKIKLPLKLKLDGLKMIINQRLTDLKRTKVRKDRRQKIGLFEVLKLTPELKKFILKTETKPNKKFQEKLEKLATDEGFKSLLTDYRQKVKDGLLAK